MDSPELPRDLLVAGAEFYRSIKSLGLKPSSLFWAYDLEQEQFGLWLVWPGVDKFGPLAIHRLLFAAFKSSVFPDTLDPFTVYLHCPKANLVKGLIGQMNTDDVDAVQVGFSTKLETEPTAPVFEVQKNWVYVKNSRRSSISVNRDWQRFNASISKLAA